MTQQCFNLNFVQLAATTKKKRTRSNNYQRTSWSICWSTFMIAETTCVLIVSTCMRSTDPFVYFLVIKGEEKKEGERKKERKEERKKVRKKERWEEEGRKNEWKEERDLGKVLRMAWMGL